MKLSSFKFIIFFIASALIVEISALQKIVLETNDHCTFEVDKTVMKFIQDSKVLSDCLESVGDQQEKVVIPINGLNDYQLRDLLIYWKQFNREEAKVVKADLYNTCTGVIVSLINSATYLGVDQLASFLKKILLKKCNNKGDWFNATENTCYKNQFSFADPATNKELGLRLLQKRRYNLKQNCTEFSERFIHRNHLATFSNDGSQLAIGNTDLSIRLWHPTEKKLIETNCSNYVTLKALAFNVQNNRKIAYGNYGLVKIFDLESQKYVQEFSYKHEASTSSIVYSENLIINDNNKDIYLWDERQPKKIGELNEHFLNIYSLVINDNNTLLSGSNDGLIKKWDLRKLSCEKTIDKSNTSIMSLSYSPDYQQFASGDNDGVINIWDANTGNCLETMRPKRKYDSIIKLAYLKKNYIIAHHYSYISSVNSEVNIYKKNNCLHTIHLSNKRQRDYYDNIVSFSPNGKKIAVINPHNLRIIEFANLDSYKNCTLVDAMKELHNNAQFESIYP